ncbi:hypothetical protein Dvina_10615 [Dactylosporangium vinaceum]|uniref:Uncharacterized protein n=1 Tax=Dactylosporangium vinaceum TaxID=53362 RepID=A0ABV5MBM2_9ACTN|nr:hypothetical protein [Dactylosporangium vinaceum]UAB98494.1 hypothetical protein Dvina_10615 [Dactylosporangium vinaceum]
MPILVVLATVLAVLTPELSLVLLGAAWTYFLIAPVLEARRRRVRDPSAAAERWLAGNPDPAEVAFVAGGPSRTPGARIPVLATTLATAGLLYPVRARPLVPPVWRQCAYLSASGIAASAVVLGLRHGWWGGYGAFGVLLGVGLVFGTIPMFVAPDPPGGVFGVRSPMGERMLELAAQRPEYAEALGDGPVDWSVKLDDLPAREQREDWMDTVVELLDTAADDIWDGDGHHSI